MSPEAARYQLWYFMKTADCPSKRGIFAGFLIALKYVAGDELVLEIEPWSYYWPKGDDDAFTERRI